MPPVRKTNDRARTVSDTKTKTASSSRAKSDAEKAKQRALAEQRRMKLEKQKKAERKQRNAYIGAIVLLSVIGFVLFLVIFGGALLLDFRGTAKEPQYTLTQTYTEGEEGTEKPKTKTEEYSVEGHGGVAFVSLTEMAHGLKLLPTGDAVVRTLHFSDGSTAAFRVGTPYVTVNGQTVTLGADSYLSSDGGSDVRVPLEFFQRYVEGVTFTEEHRGQKVAFVMHTDGGIRTAMAANEPLPRPVSAGTGEAGAYLTDVAAYERYIEPENPDEYLSLVNHSNRAVSNVPPDLVPVADTRYDREPVMLRKAAAMALEAMFIELRANGYLDVSVTTGYVSYDEQAKLYSRTFAEFATDYDEAEAYRRTNALVAEAGCGENILGLSVDLHNLTSPSQAFEAEAAYKWLYTNCAEFGFVLRYPKNKSDVTGFSFEPYHFRFVGRTHARKMMRGGMCLEEYVESLEEKPEA